MIFSLNVDNFSLDKERSHCDLVGNTGKEYISLGCGVVSGFAACNVLAGLKMVDGMLHNGTNPIKGDPVIRIPLDAWKHTEIHVPISVSGKSYEG